MLVEVDIQNHFRTLQNQEVVTRKIGERVREIEEVIIELKQELSSNEKQTERLIESFKHLEFVHSQAKRPLKIALKCLNIREGKVDIENVKDLVEKYLKREVDTVRIFQGRMEIMMQVIEMQIYDTQEKQEFLKKEIGKKETAHDIDQKCHVLKEKSVDLNKFSGIERVDPGSSEPSSWKSECRRYIKESSESREVSEQLIMDVDTIVEEVDKELICNWNRTNLEFKLRISEIIKLRNQLKTNVRLVVSELLEIAGLVDQLTRAKLAKEAPLKLAQTR